MIAVDTNILVYAHRRDSAFHERARDCVKSLAEGPNGWAIPWQCVHEFLSIVTSPRIFKGPTPLESALTQIELWRASPTLTFLAEEDGYWETLLPLVSASKVVGPAFTMPASLLSSCSTERASCSPRIGTSAASPPFASGIRSEGPARSRA